MIKGKGRIMLLGGITAAAYAVVAIAANFTTKYATQLLPGGPDMVLLIQLSVMLVAVRILHALGWVNLPPLSVKRWLLMAPMSITYGLHAALALRALAALNVPMYNTLKRTTPMLVLIAKWIIDRRAPNAQVAASVVAIVAGCIIAGKGDLAFNPHAYLVALMCAAFQAAYILLTEYMPPPTSEPSSSLAHSVAHTSIIMQPLGSAVDKKAHTNGPAPHDLGEGTNSKGDKGGPGVVDERLIDEHVKRALPDAAFQMQLRQALVCMADAMQYIPLTCLPLVVLWVAVTDQMALVTAIMVGYASEGAMNVFSFWLATIASSDFLLMGTLTLCTQINSALTTTVVGALKGTLAVVLGFVLLGGVGPTTPTNIVGITLNCLGGVWYAIAKYKEGIGVSRRL